MERNLVLVPPPPSSETATPPEPGHPLKEPEESEGSVLHWQTAAVTACLRADVRWDEQSTDGEGSEEDLEMTG